MGGCCSKGSVPRSVEEPSGRTEAPEQNKQSTLTTVPTHGSSEASAVARQEKAIEKDKAQEAAEETKFVPEDTSLAHASPTRTVARDDSQTPNQPISSPGGPLLSPISPISPTDDIRETDIHVFLAGSPHGAHMPASPSMLPTMRVRSPLSNPPRAAQTSSKTPVSPGTIREGIEGQPQGAAASMSPGASPATPRWHMGQKALPSPTAAAAAAAAAAPVTAKSAPASKGLTSLNVSTSRIPVLRASHSSPTRQFSSSHYRPYTALPRTSAMSRMEAINTPETKIPKPSTTGRLLGRGDSAEFVPRTFSFSQHHGAHDGRKPLQPSSMDHSPALSRPKSAHSGVGRSPRTPPSSPRRRGSGDFHLSSSVRRTRSGNTTASASSTGVPFGSQLPRFGPRPLLLPEFEEHIHTLPGPTSPSSLSGSSPEGRIEYL